MWQQFWPVQSTRGRSTEFDNAALPALALWRNTSITTGLVARHAVLFHLLKLALQFSLALHLLLGAAHVDQLAVKLLPVHLVYSLEGEKTCTSVERHC